MNIYKTCPDVYNERFRLRLVTQEDCEHHSTCCHDSTFTKRDPLHNHRSATNPATIANNGITSRYKTTCIKWKS